MSTDQPKEQYINHFDFIEEELKKIINDKENNSDFCRIEALKFLDEINTKRPKPMRASNK